MTPTRTFAVVLAIAGLACGAYALTRGDDAASAAPPPPLETALWSPRRVPQPLVDAVGAQKLQAALDDAVNVGGVQSCFVVTQGGAPLATHGTDLALIPASTQKLLTATAALAVLGADATLDTKVVAPSPPQDGTVDRLYLVGGGDPLLETPDVQALREQIPELKGSVTTSLASLADAIVKAGVKRIPKGIGADDTRYEALRYIPTWDSSYRTEGQVGPVGALTVNDGFSQLRPPVPVDDPAVFAAQKLGELLTARGVTIGKTPSREQAPANAVEIAKVSSPPLRQVIGEELSTSDNLGSEMLTREIGLHVSQQGTTAAGTQAIAQEMQKLGLSTDHVVMNDGSGLDKGDRATCPLLAGVIDLSLRPQFSPVLDGLSVAGQTGTLVDQLSSSLNGKVRGKTGTLNGATALAGVIDVTRPLRFAFIANGSLGNERDAIAFRGHIVDILATFPDAPPADELVPAPGARPVRPGASSTSSTASTGPSTSTPGAPPTSAP
jgi:serine-type D-Ala-D-Ala carboxypeptidase/endopeptidase (penicillin-binding protein 4)